MERPERVPQLYGYTVCLVAVVVALISISSLIENTFSLAAPQVDLGEFGWEPSVSSFEAYRATYDRERRFASPSGEVRPEAVPEAVLRQRYEALRADRIERTRLRSIRSLVTSGIALLLAIGLFVVHWRWVRRLGVPGTAA